MSLKKNQEAINIALKKKIHIGNFSEKNVKKNYFFVEKLLKKDNKVIFDVYKQFNQVRKVIFFLNSLLLKKQPIFFFGLNSNGLDTSSLSKMNFINKKIFKLAFFVPPGKKFIEVDRCLKDFFNLLFDNNGTKGLKMHEQTNLLNSFKKRVLSFAQNGDLIINGCFLNNWVEGAFSNKHSLESKLNPLSRGSFESFKVLFSLDLLKALNKEITLPGAVIFFSREGYDLFFKEFSKLGIPIICIVDYDQFLDFVDYPLPGDLNSFETFLFYINILKQIFNK